VVKGVISTGNYPYNPRFPEDNTITLKFEQVALPRNNLVVAIAKFQESATYRLKEPVGSDIIYNEGQGLALRTIIRH
jgi:hypothetical protein